MPDLSPSFHAEMASYAYLEHRFIAMEIIKQCRMAEAKVFQMSFAKVYDLLVSKVEKKGRARAEVDTVTRWLTGYTQPELDDLLASDTTYGDFLRQAPKPNPDRTLIRGVVCGVRVEEVTDPLMREARYLDNVNCSLQKLCTQHRLNESTSRWRD